MEKLLHSRNKSGFATINSSGFTREYSHLKAQQEFFDRSQHAVINNMKTVNQQFAKDIENMYTDVENSRKEESKKLKDMLMSIVTSMKDLKSAVSSDDKLKDLDVDSYRQDLIEVEREISEIKELTDKNLIHLEKDEENLWNHIQSIEQKIDDWSKPQRAAIVKIPSFTSIKKIKTQLDCNETIEFQKFLRDTGGHMGGWDEADHLMYIRLRCKHRNINTLLENIAFEMPGKSRDELMEHEEWYIKYEILRTRQKAAIEEWKASRAKMKAESQEVNEKSADISEANKLNNEREIYEKKKKLAEWKKMKKMEKETNEAKINEDKEKRKMKAKISRIKQMEKQAELGHQREEKKKIKESYQKAKKLSEVEEREINAAIANKAIKEYWERDCQFLANQKQRKTQSQQDISSRKVKQSTSLQKQRDPLRLLKATEVWKERVQKLKNADISANQTLHVNNIPHLGVPNWRKGLP